ncbi:MAG: hypothetical protein CMP67_09190 [Flavobacteriales bacterium]|nr:hypothetical protein [Flavobacteriales bacterium]|tara:strand:+ start:10105 stop:11361 length:1257 start_codon:yes stop_codon:yes gene_type:complete
MKISFVSFCLLFSFWLNAQKPITYDKNHLKLSLHKYVNFSEEKIQFKQYGETWFTTVIDLINLGEIPPLSSEPWGQKALLVSLFPDSTIILGIDPVTQEPYHAFIHGMADIINPSKTPSQWADQWTDILIDSIKIPYVYTRNTSDSIIDTMFVDYIKSRPDSLLSYYDLNDNDKADFGEFLHQSLYHTNRYTNKLDEGQVFRTDTILLTSSDSTTADDFFVKFKGIDVNDSVKSSQRYGVYIRFHPGYEWDLNDTIDNFNEFLLLTREQNESESPRQIWPFSSGFCSYTLTKYIRYNMHTEAYYLLPGIVPVPEWSLEHLLVSYKFTTNALSNNEINGLEKLTLFPNPVNDFINVYFSTNKIQSIEIRVFDVMGKEVFYDKLEDFNLGENHYRYDTFSLPPGLYTLKLGDSSEKFIVK